MSIGVLLNRQHAVCDADTIYIERQPIAERPKELSHLDWDKVCRFICGEAPKVHKLEFQDTPLDQELYDRLKVFTDPIDVRSFEEKQRDESMVMK